MVVPPPATIPAVFSLKFYRREMSADHNIFQELKSYGQKSDADMPLFATALALAHLAHPGRSMSSYYHHMHKMCQLVAQRFEKLIDSNAADTAETRIAALKYVLHDQQGYCGNQEFYNDLRNADMIEVIDRRKGLPVALAILVIEVANAQGWSIQGLNFPWHFIVRIDHNGQRVIFDPFHEFKILNAVDLRQIIKAKQGAEAELHAHYFDPVSPREIVLRLQNNIKFRLIEREEYAVALNCVEQMKCFAPREYRLLLDESVLRARLGQVEEAINCAREYYNHATNPQDKYDAELLLRTLENSFLK